MIRIRWRPVRSLRPLIAATALILSALASPDAAAGDEIEFTSRVWDGHELLDDKSEERLETLIQRLQKETRVRMIAIAGSLPDKLARLEFHRRVKSAGETWCRRSPKRKRYHRKCIVLGYDIVGNSVSMWWTTYRAPSNLGPRLTDIQDNAASHWHSDGVEAVLSITVVELGRILKSNAFDDLDLREYIADINGKALRTPGRAPGDARPGAKSQHPPMIVRPIHDHADVLSLDAERRLAERITALRKKTGVQILLWLSRANAFPNGPSAFATDNAPPWCTLGEDGSQCVLFAVKLFKGGSGTLHFGYAHSVRDIAPDGFQVALDPMLRINTTRDIPAGLEQMIIAAARIIDPEVVGDVAAEPSDAAMATFQSNERSGAWLAMIAAAIVLVIVVLVVLRLVYRRIDAERLAHMSGYSDAHLEEIIAMAAQRQHTSVERLTAQQVREIAGDLDLDLTQVDAALADFDAHRRQTQLHLGERARRRRVISMILLGSIAVLGGVTVISYFHSVSALQSLRDGASQYAVQQRAAEALEGAANAMYTGRDDAPELAKERARVNGLRQQAEASYKEVATSYARLAASFPNDMWVGLAGLPDRLPDHLPDQLPDTTAASDSTAE